MLRVEERVIVVGGIRILDMNLNIIRHIPILVRQLLLNESFPNCKHELKIYEA